MSAMSLGWWGRCAAEGVVVVVVEHGGRAVRGRTTTPGVLPCPTVGGSMGADRSVAHGCPTGEHDVAKYHRFRRRSALSPTDG